MEEDRRKGEGPPRGTGNEAEGAQVERKMSVIEKKEEVEVEETVGLFTERKKKRPQWKIKIDKALDNFIIVIFMTLVTIYALFFDDLRVIYFPKVNDDYFFGVTLFGMICFAIEIFFASIAKDDYFNGFFFWLDLVSTISMIPDCGWIWDPLIGGGGSDVTDLSKTSRTARVTRVIRVIRLIRLIRIVKLYKQAKLAQKKAEDRRLANMKKKQPMHHHVHARRPTVLIEAEERQKIQWAQESETQRIHPLELQKEDSFDREAREADEKLAKPKEERERAAKEAAKKEEDEEEEDVEIPIESKIGRTLSERTTKTVVMLVLGMLFTMPFLQLETYVTTDTSFAMGLRLLQ